GEGGKGEDATRAHAVVEVGEPRTVRENLRPQGHELVRSVEQFVDAAGLCQGSGQLIAEETNAEPVMQERVGRERRIQPSLAQIELTQAEDRGVVDFQTLALDVAKEPESQRAEGIDLPMGATVVVSAQCSYGENPPSPA